MGAEAVATHGRSGAGNETPRAVVRPHYPCLDGLRAVAVLILFFQHAGFSTGLQFREGFRWMGHMEIGPTTFFVLSAFLLYQPFTAANLSGAAPPQRWTTFLKARAFRVIPMYWVSLALLIAFFRARTDNPFAAGLKVDGIADGLALFTFTQVYFPEWFFHGIPAAYTLNVEVAFYLFLPLWAFAVRRWCRGRTPVAKLRRELGALALLAVGSFAWRVAIEVLFEDERRACVDDPSPHLSCAAVQWLPGYLDYFAIGMALAVAVTWRGLQDREPAWMRRVGSAPDLLFAVALVLFLVYSTQLGSDPGLGYISPRRAEARHLLNALIVLFALAPGVFGPQDRGLWRRFLAWRPIAFAGLVSYGIYLWHQGWVDKGLEWTDVSGVGLRFVVVTAIAVVLSVAIATAGWYLVERPSIRRRSIPLRSWFRWLGPGPARPS